MFWNICIWYCVCIYIYIFIYCIRASIRSPGAVRARVEEIEQESRRIQCWAKCDFDRGLFLMQRWSSSYVLSKIDMARTIAKPPKLYCSLFFLQHSSMFVDILGVFCRLSMISALLQSHSRKNCATLPCRSPDRAGATADSQQLAAKQQFASELVFLYFHWGYSQFCMGPFSGQDFWWEWWRQFTN